MSKYPKAYSLGQEYRNDEQTEVKLRFYTHLPCNFSTVSLPEKRINLYVLGEFLVIEYLVFMSQKLLKDISNGKGYSYVWSYLDRVIPVVNSEIRKSRYSKGQFLLRNISVLDVSFAQVVKEDSVIVTLESGMFPDFSRLSEDNIFHNYVYIRDYIDSIKAIIYYDYEEFIKKCITSVENYFIQHNVKKTTFKQTLEKVLEPTKERYGNQTIYDNICFVYDIRNEITHNTLRIDYDKKEWGVLCHMALATLQYLFQRICQDKGESKYIFDVYLHYLGIKTIIDSIICERLEGDIQKPAAQEPKKNLDEIMFDALIIPEKLKESILLEK